jgi:hypothetical protein
MIASILAAAQSMVMIFGASSLLGVAATAVISLASAYTYTLSTIGAFGMRRFHASDADRQYSQREYLWSRFITVNAMFVIAAVFIVMKSWDPQSTPMKLGVIAILVLIRAVDCIDDVITGHFQQTGRLDIGSRITALRLVVCTLGFLVSLIITRDLMLSLIISFVLSLLVLAVLARSALQGYDPDRVRTVDRVKVWKLLWACMPLFIWGFLGMYITNAPKFGIESAMEGIAQKQAQACYGIISMPAFVISLLSGLVFHPIIHSLSRQWLDRDLVGFGRTVTRISLVILGITAACVTGGALLGLPILSLASPLVDLGGLELELAILLLGGGFTAFSAFFSTVLTIMRRQLAAAVALGVAAAFGLTSHWWAQWQGLLGVCLLFLTMYALNTLIAGVLIWWTWRSRRFKGTPHSEASTT